MIFKTKPKPHQLAYVQDASRWREPGHCLWWEPGLGKSWLVINEAAELWRAGEITGLLIVAPPGVSEQWIEDEIPKHLPDDVPRAGLSWTSAGRHTKRFQAAWQEFRREPPGRRLACLAITYPGLMTSDGTKAVQGFLAAHKGRVLYCADESTYFKTPGTKTTKKVVASAKKAAYRRALNGTPCPDSPFHLYSQVRFADHEFWERTLGLPNYDAFKSYFGLWGRGEDSNGNTWPQLLRYLNTEKLYDAFHRIGHRLRMADVHDLPTRTYELRTYELHPTQRKMYDQLEQEYQTWFACGAEVTAELAIVRRTRQQQICSGYLPADNEEDLRPLIDPKVNPRLRCLHDAIDPDAHQIVFAKYNIDVDTIAHELRGRGLTVATYDGRVPAKRRREIHRAFEEEGSIQILVAKTSAAGRGLTLNRATRTIYYNNTYSADERIQSEARNYRIGQTREVVCLDIVARDTVDEHILDTLRRKRVTAAFITGDELLQWI